MLDTEQQARISEEFTQLQEIAAGQRNQALANGFGEEAADMMGVAVFEGLVETYIAGSIAKAKTGRRGQK